MFGKFCDIFSELLAGATLPNGVTDTDVDFFKKAQAKANEVKDMRV